MSNRGTSTTKEMISDSAYIEILKNCSKWNSRVMGGRKRSETAVYDQQTGIVHRPTEHLFRHPSERCRAQNPMQVYVYPPRHWVKPKTTLSAAIEVNYFLRVNPALKEAVNAKTEQTQPQSMGENASTEQQQLSMPLNNNNPGRAATGNTAKIYENEFDLEYDLDEPDYNDQSDEDDWGASRKKKKRPFGAGTSTGGGRSAGRKAAVGPTMNTGTIPIVVKIPKSDAADLVASGGTTSQGTSVAGGGTTATTTTSTVEPRPFICQLCGAKYKSRPGLTYHKIHVHQSESNNNSETPKSPLISSKVQISDYCDFCLGDTSKNADGKPEELITCHDCGRSGHPSCLKFTKNMLISTKRFGWQCIECKSCAICGTSENDDQLLFCDDCDRGFHLYCLRPPLKAPPETDWSCHLCVKAFGPDASINKTKGDEQNSNSGNGK